MSTVVKTSWDKRNKHILLESKDFEHIYDMGAHVCNDDDGDPAIRFDYGYDFFGCYTGYLYIEEIEDMVVNAFEEWRHYCSYHNLKYKEQWNLLTERVYGKLKRSVVSRLTAIVYTFADEEEVIGDITINFNNDAIGNLTSKITDEIINRLVNYSKIFADLYYQFPEHKTA